MNFELETLEEKEMWVEMSEKKKKNSQARCRDKRSYEILPTYVVFCVKREENRSFSKLKARVFVRGNFKHVDWIAMQCTLQLLISVWY